MILKTSILQEKVTIFISFKIFHKNVYGKFYDGFLSEWGRPDRTFQKPDPQPRFNKNADPDLAKLPGFATLWICRLRIVWSEPLISGAAARTHEGNPNRPASGSIPLALVLFTNQLLQEVAMAI